MRRRTEGTLGHGSSAVDRSVGGAANIKGVVLIVVEGDGVCGASFASLKDFPRLGPDVRLGSQLEQSLREGSRRAIILQLEAGVQRQLKSQHEMHGLQVAVREIGGHLDDALLIRLRGFGQLLPLHFHGDADDVMAANFDELLRLRRLLPVLDDEEGNGEENLPEGVAGLLEFAGRRHLIRLLKTLKERGELQADGGQAGSRTGLLEVAMRMIKDRMQRRQCIDRGATAGDRLHDERLERLEVDDADLVEEKPHPSFHGASDKVVDRQLRIVAPNLRLTRPFRRRYVET